MHLDTYLSSETGRNLTQVLFVYLTRTSELHAKEIKMLVQSLPEPYKPHIMSTYDKIVLEGIEQGIERGIERGIEQGDRQRAFTGIRNMLRKGFSVEDIVSILEVPKAWVEEVQSSDK